MIIPKIVGKLISTPVGKRLSARSTQCVRITGKFSDSVLSIASDLRRRVTLADVRYRPSLCENVAISLRDSQFDPAARRQRHRGHGGKGSYEANRGAGTGRKRRYRSAAIHRKRN